MSPSRFAAELTLRLGSPVFVQHVSDGFCVLLTDHPETYMTVLKLIPEAIVPIETELADILIQSNAVTVH